MNPKRTELTLKKNPDKITKNSTLVSVGARFANQFSEELEKHHFKNLNNPYGTIYNPISIFNAVNTSIKNKPLDQNAIVEVNGKWNHYDFHSEMGADSKDELVAKLSDKITATHETLKKTDFLLLTFGSAFVYTKASDNKIVANCHKTPTNNFNKSLLTPKEIVDAFRHMYTSLNHVKNIVLMVSPVLLLEDSLTLNTVSKSVLRLACHYIMSEFPHVKYFPAFELLKSDLRDYEYVKEDLVTPSNEAMDYIVEKFMGAYVD